MKMLNKSFVSGFGQLHTNEFDPKKPDKLLTTYSMISWDAVQALVDNPQQVDKTQAQWLIPSTYPSRRFKQQEQNGEYWLLWADLDGEKDKVTKELIKPAPTIPELKEIIPSLIGGCDFEVYNSRGATPENPKARILIPLDKPLCFAEWNLAQQILNDKFS